MSTHPTHRTLVSPAALAVLGIAGGVVLAAGVFGAACSSSSGGGYVLYTGGGNLDSGPGASGDDSGLQLFTVPADPGASAVYVTISGEANAIKGYPFPPGDYANDTYFFDGWEYVIEEFIVVVDHVVLWSNPNHNPTNQGDLTGMTQVAHLDGPFVVDLHKGGPLTGQGGTPEQAMPLGVIASQNDNGGAAFDPTTPYGFGFSTVQATYGAYNVNLTSEELGDFAAMVQNGYSVFYKGRLTWKGDQSKYPCVSTTVDGGFDYSQMPNAGIEIQFGFPTPTDYVNCQNMKLQGPPTPGEDYPRGVQISTSQSTIAQLTLHMDHPFWESFAENSPVHFDQIAAQYAGMTDGGVIAHTEDMKGVPFYAFTDRNGTPVPWRNCAGTNYSPPGNGQMSFDTLSVPVDPRGTCTGAIGDDYTKDDCKAERDYYDYIRFTQSTQGHLNSQGLCFIDRKWPAPAGGS
jgi:hypothetical protein